jgi:hypothetical protein
VTQITIGLENNWEQLFCSSVRRFAQAGDAEQHVVALICANALANSSIACG